MLATVKKDPRLCFPPPSGRWGLLGASGRFGRRGLLGVYGRVGREGVEGAAGAWDLLLPRGSLLPRRPPSLGRGLLRGRVRRPLRPGQRFRRRPPRGV